MVGVRYQGAFGGLGVLAYGVYMGSGTADYTGPAQRPRPAGPFLAPRHCRAANTTASTSAEIGSGGVAVTFAGFTVGGNVIGGLKNGYASPMPEGGGTPVGFHPRVRSNVTEP